MPHRKLRYVVAAVLVGSGLRWLVDSNAWSGPVVLRLTRTHGVHLHDWVGVVCFALAGVLVLAGRRVAAPVSTPAPAFEEPSAPATLAEALAGAAPAPILPARRPTDAPVPDEELVPDR